MATKLKVSRGSFYWHFRDIADFRAQLLRRWQGAFEPIRSFANSTPGRPNRTV